MPDMVWGVPQMGCSCCSGTSERRLLRCVPPLSRTPYSTSAMLPVLVIRTQTFFVTSPSPAKISVCINTRDTNYIHHNNTENDMVINYIGCSGGTSQMSSCVSYAVKHAMGEVELVFEETTDRVLLINLQTRMKTGDKLLVCDLAQLASTAVGVLDTLKAFVQKGISVVAVSEGVVDEGLLAFMAAVVSEIQQGSPSSTMESARVRGQRHLLHG